MEFNPLDLLASAAELQQRHDDPPNIMTRQRKAAALPANKTITISSVPKENRNANKGGKSNGVIVVKKIKIGANSDLEKMLDEHNYGNAKKGIKFEKNITTVSSDGSVSGVVSSISTGRESDQKPVESNENETSERLDVTENINNLQTESASENSLHSDTSESVQSGKKETSDKDNLLPEVKKESTGSVLSSLGPCSSNKSIKADTGDKQEGCLLDKSNIVQDNIHVQTDKMVLNELDSKMCNDTTAKLTSNTIQIVTTKESMNSSSFLEKLGKDSNDKTKKVIVKVSPENNIFIEKKNLDLLEDKKLIVQGSSDEAGLIKTGKSDFATSGSLSNEEKLVFPISQPSILLKDHNNIKSVTVIRSLLTSDNGSNKSMKTAKPHNGSLRVNCDPESYLRVLEEKMDTCDSPKSRLDLDPFCNSSSNGIHLLSPDRRNPDCVGVVESPVTSAFTDSSNSCETETEMEKSEDVLKTSPEIVFNTNKITVMCGETDKNLEISAEQTENKSVKQKELNEIPEVTEGKQKIIISVKEPITEQGSSYSQASSDGKETNVFRFDSDHCYAGLPGRVNNVDPREFPSDEETDTDDEEEEDEDGSSPDASPTELSQDSGYGDITQSPDSEKKEENAVKPNPEKLVPVLISFNKSGALTVHTDKGVSKELPKQIFTLAENHTLDSNANLLNTDKGQNLTKPATVTSNVRPLLLSPIGKGTASVLIDPSKISLVDPKTVTNMVSPPIRTSQTQQVSPPKFGKFRIGSFASFSNAGMDIDSPVKEKTKVERSPKSSLFSRSASHPHSLSSLRSPGDRSLLRRMDSYKDSSLSSSLSPPVPGYANHIQHDHDYCVHSSMPSTIDSAKENTQKEAVHKNKSGHVKPKKYESELQKELLKNDKPKKKGKSVKNMVEKDDSYDELELMLDEERYRDLPTYADSVRVKSRSERYIEQKSSEPKMKIAGSTSFQDQFVYFMNTKKRSRRRESRDGQAPFQVPFDKIILPPHKPGDIVVPHLTDADIENLKLFNKQNKHSATATHSQHSDPFSSKLNLNNVDEESKIINTILSLENESLTEEQIPYSENMEMYGQSDILNLLPEQMNLTPEQMDLLFSAVDEVQNSSPNLVSEKLATSTGDSAFDHFAATEQEYTDPIGGKPVTESGDKAKAIEPADTVSVKNDTDVSLPTESPAVPAEESSVVEVNVKSPGSSEVQNGQDYIDTEHKDSAVSNCDSDNSLVTNTETNSNIIRKTPAALSEVINDTITTGTFTSLNQNSDSETVENNLGQVGNSASVFSNLTSSVNPELPLPTLDRSSLDLLSNDYKLDRSDLFSDTAIQDSPQSVPGSLPVRTPSDYNAPWIVTVSMYWNDLPAIMINNLPYVRLVDIHKQILPAKDTGILKKRCQLMGIEVENCTEMQRYFLVQYGKAINSKSTLIVSKDAAKELIGYYVEPQPAKPLGAGKEHKSIIEHRREQLRRIALAKRAALRAEKLEKEKALEVKVGNNLLKPVDGNEAESAFGATDAPRQRSQSLSSRLPYTLSSGSKPQRSTRHKKINFLELLRGDSSTSLPDNEETTTNEGSNKRKQTASEGVPAVKAGTKRKRYSGSGDRTKVKVVKYVESESSESTSDSDMDYTDDSSDSTETEKVVVVKKPKKKRTSLFNRKPKKRKYKKNVVLKKNIVKVPSFKVKFKQAKQVSKEQVKPGKDASISRVHIVKMSSDFEKSHSKQSVKKHLTVKDKPVHIESKIAVTESNKSEIKSGNIAEEKATPSNESGIKTSEIHKDERRNTVKELDDDPDTELDNYLNDVKENSAEKDTAENMKDEEKYSVDNITKEVKDEITIKTDEIIEENESKISEVQENPLKEVEKITEDEDSKMETKDIELRSKLEDTEGHETNSVENSVEEISEKADTLDKYVLAIMSGEKDQNSEINDSESSVKVEAESDNVSSVQAEIKDIQMETDEQTPCKCDEKLMVQKTYNASVASCSSYKDLAAEAITNKKRSPSRTDNINSGKTGSSSRLASPVGSDSNLSEASCSRAASRCSENSESTGGNMNFYLLNKDTDVVEEIPPVRIVHRDATPQNNGVRVRRQLGEIFVEHYNNKRSFCIRCYTCRKMMSVDHFMRHLHDVSGGLVSTDVPQIIEPSESDMTDSEIKSWEVFQRKKELFDNNQLPSDVGRSSIVCNVDSDSNQSSAEKPVEEPSRGPIIKHTPVSPMKRDKVKVVPRPKPEQRTRKKIPALLQPKNNKTIEKSKSWNPKESPKESKDGVRASSRKRKASQLYSSDEYTFYKKLPRLQNE